MSKPNQILKVVATPTPDRAALAAAIAHADAAAKSVDEATTAKQNAISRLETAWSERSRLEEIERTKSYASQSNDHVIAALASDAEVETLDRDPQAEIKRQLADAGAEVERWRELRDLANQEVERREIMLRSAQRQRELAANAVVAASFDVGKLIEETAAAQDIVIAQRARLMQLMSLAPDGPEREQLRAFLARGWLAVDWERHASTDRLRAFQAALLNDAAAPAPK